MSWLDLENHLFARISSALHTIAPNEARDIYALYLVLSLDEAGGYRPSLTSLTWLSHADVTPEKAKNYGSRWSGWAFSGEAALNLCDEESDPVGFDLQTQLCESLLDGDNAQQKWAAFQFAWPFRWSEDLDEGQTARFNAMLDALEIPAEDRRYLFSTMSALAPFDLSHAFFPILSSVIQRLHESQVLGEVCGRAIPVGVMATNDVGYEYGLDPTRQGNPAGLSRKMEEWMTGEPYSAVAAREELEREIAARPIEEQARYWARAALEIEEFFWNKQRSPLTDDLEKRGLISRADGLHTQHLRVSQRLQDLLPHAAENLVALAEERADNSYPTLGYDKTPADHAEQLLSTLTSIASKGERDNVPEAVIERLIALMHRLWPEYKEMRTQKKRTGFCLQHAARALHALRPERFAPWKQNPRDAGEFNFADFNLL